MKPITIRNQQYYYKVVQGWTQFYKGKEDTSFIFYGVCTRHIYLFNLNSIMILVSFTSITYIALMTITIDLLTFRLGSFIYTTTRTRF